MIADVPPTRFQDLFDMVSVQVGRQPALELRPLLQNLHESLCHSPVSPRQVRGSIRRLLEFLRQDETDANCDAVSDFVLVENEWEMDWSYLPSRLEDLMFDLSRTHRHREGEPIETEQFTPARLLERLGPIPAR